MKKFITTILFLGLILSLNFNLFLIKPKVAKAADFIGGFSQIIDTLKQSVGDPIATFAKKPAAKIIFNELTRLMRGEFSKENEPSAILDWNKYLNRRKAVGTAMFREELDALFINADRLDLQVKRTLYNLGLGQYAQDVPSFSQYARSTLKDDLGFRYSDFVESDYSLGAIGEAGWNAWYSLIKPENNAFGLALMAEEARRKYEEEAMQAASEMALANQGFNPRQECIEYATKQVPDEAKADAAWQWYITECKPMCEANFGGFGGNPTLYRKCDAKCVEKLHENQGATMETPTGICTEYRVQNVGSEIHKMLEKELDFDIDFLITADELEDLFSMLMTSILGGVTHGPGWGTTQMSEVAFQSIQPESWAFKPYKMDMSFFQLKRPIPSADERKKSRTEVLNLIYEAVGKLSRQTATCKSVTRRRVQGQIPENIERELTRLETQLLELLESFTAQLYSQETGFAVQSEFRVLDPPDAPFGYGATWEEIPFRYYPPDCAKFMKPCSEFSSGLPNWGTLDDKCKICLSTINQNLSECKAQCGYNETCLKNCTLTQAANQAADFCPLSDAELEELNEPQTPSNPGGGGGGGGSGCFLAGTKISMPDGSFKNVEDIEIGNRVLSFYEDKLAAKSVLKLFPSLVDHYYILKTENHEANVTGRHRFYTGDGFKPVKELSVGDKIYVLKNKKLIPEKIVHKELIKKPVKVYNFNVENTHTYFANGFAVHNMKDEKEPFMYIIIDGKPEWPEEPEEEKLLAQAVPTISFPEFEFPEFEFPEFDFPEFDFPEFDFPEFDFPEFDFPEFDFPEFDFPEFDFPTISFPEMEFPEFEFDDFEFPEDEEIPDTYGTLPGFAGECGREFDLMHRIENACAFCIEKAEGSCQRQVDPVAENECMEQFCGNEELGLSGREFYYKCGIQEKQDACYACLKQHFMPASYAIEIRDYIGRAFVKHPYLLIEKYYSREKKDTSDVANRIIKNALFPDQGWAFDSGKEEKAKKKHWEYYLNLCIGACPEAMKSETKCPNFTKSQGIPVGLVCRALPGDAICGSCTTTADPIDFIPSDDDCGGVRYGALNPITLITNAAYKHRSKYCRALSGHNTTFYNQCTEFIEERPEELSCEEGCDYAQTSCEATCSEEALQQAGLIGIITAPICRFRCTGEHNACMTGCATVITPCEDACYTIYDTCEDGCAENEACIEETCAGPLTACLTGCEPEAGAVCGNSAIESGEVCDDGNTVFGDGCSADCLSNETCGNGYIDTAVGEGCDDGNTVSNDGCSAACQLEYSPGYTCFLEGTEILMADGSSKNVEDINIGDRVLSFSEDKLTTESASKVFSSLTDYYYTLKTENYEVNVTGEHPFYTGEGFRTVKELLVGDKIYVLENGKLTPKKIVHKELVKKQAKIYNLTVKGTRTYFANGFAVHNKLPGDFEP